MIAGMTLSNSIGLRPARGEDEPFFEQLFKSSRADLWMAEREPDYIAGVLDQQWRSREYYYQQKFPRAMYMVIEVEGKRAGRLVIDAGPNEVRVVDIHLAGPFRGQGYGTELLRGLQRASEISRTPLTLVAAADNPGALNLYRELGFVVEETEAFSSFLSWTPR